MKMPEDVESSLNELRNRWSHSYNGERQTNNLESYNDNGAYVVHSTETR